MQEHVGDQPVVGDRAAEVTGEDLPMYSRYWTMIGRSKPAAWMRSCSCVRREAVADRRRDRVAGEPHQEEDHRDEDEDRRDDQEAPDR